MNLIKGKPVSKTKTGPVNNKSKKAKTVLINKDTIEDVYAAKPDNDLPVKDRIMDLLIDAITANAFQHAHLDVPLDPRHVGPTALNERTLCLLVGKLAYGEQEYFIWVYKSFTEKWIAVGTEVEHPAVVSKALHIPITPKNAKNFRGDSKEYLPRSYAGTLEATYADAVEKVREEYRAEAAAARKCKSSDRK